MDILRSLLAQWGLWWFLKWFSLDDRGYWNNVFLDYFGEAVGAVEYAVYGLRNRNWNYFEGNRKCGKEVRVLWERNFWNIVRLSFLGDRCMVGKNTLFRIVLCILQLYFPAYEVYSEWCSNLRILNEVNETSDKINRFLMKLSEWNS